MRGELLLSVILGHSLALATLNNETEETQNDFQARDYYYYNNFDSETEETQNDPEGGGHAWLPIAFGIGIGIISISRYWYQNRNRYWY